MFTGFTEETIRFFLDLKFHNNSAFFHENHDRYVEEVQHVLGEPREKSLFYYFELGPDRLGWGMGFWDENREALDLFRKRMQANPDGTLALLDDLGMNRHKLILGGSIHKKMAIPADIPERLRRWYLAKDFYIYKDNPDYRMIYSDRILKEVRKDFRSLAPLHRLLRGYVTETTPK